MHTTSPGLVRAGWMVDPSPRPNMENTIERHNELIKITAYMIRRTIATTCISLTQYGTNCVYIVIMGKFAQNLLCEAGLEVWIASTVSTL